MFSARGDINRKNESTKDTVHIKKTKLKNEDFQQEASSKGAQFAVFDGQLDR